MRRAALAACFLGLLALGAWARLRAWPEVFTGTDVFLAPTDGYYYARLAELSARAFPAPVTFDAWVGYPGMGVQWPPGNAWLLAALLKLSGAGPFTPRGLTALAWFGPGLFLLYTLLLAGLTRKVLGGVAAVAAAGILLLTPDSATVSELGEADHHLHEIFLGAVIPLCLLAALRGRTWIRWAVGAGVAVAAGHFLCSGGFLLLPPLALGLLPAHWLARPRRWRRLRVALTAALVALPLVAIEAAYLGRLRTIDYVRLSGFHVALLAAIALGLALPFLRTPRRHRRPVPELAGGALAGLVLLGYVALSPLVPALRTALSHLGRHSLILAEADESAPLFASGFSSALDSLGAALFALPLVAILLVLAARRRHPAALVLLAAVAAETAFTLSQNRFARPLIGTLAVAAPLALLAARRIGGERILAALLFVACIAPTGRIFPRAEGPHEVLSLTRGTLAFLRDRTPSPGDRWDPNKIPSYGVLGPWIVGHLVATVGERPVVASPFGQVEEAERAVLRSARAYGETDGEKLFALCSEIGIRYALAIPYPGGQGALSRALERPVETPLLETLREKPAALGHFRPVFLTPEKLGDRPLGRVYEVVPGAHLGLSAAAGTRFKLVVPLLDGSTLEAEGDAGQDPVVPYAGEDLAGPIQVAIQGKTLAFSPSVEALRLGSKVKPLESLEPSARDR
jgi:asparagine N-glycosylation enzyme membrane subunit Stt3